MKVFFIVSSQREVEHALTLKAGEQPIFLATNRALHAYCVEKKYTCTYLNDDLIQPEHRAVNRWVYEEIIRITTLESIPLEERLFLDAIFFDLKVVLVRAMKYTRVFQIVLAEAPQGSEIIFFDDKPFLFGEILSATVERFFAAKQFRLATLTSVSNKRPDNRGALNIKAWATQKFDALYRVIVKPGKKEEGVKRLLVSGTLSHMAGIVDKLLENKKLKLIFCEQGFNREKSRFCSQRAIPFVLCPEARRPASVSIEFLKKHPARYADTDYSFVWKAVLSNMKNIDFLNRPVDVNGMIRLMKKWGVDAVLLDEDFAVRRAFSLSARELKLPRTVLSHAVPGITLLDKGSVPQKYLDSAETLVQSAHEKEVYISMYYDPKRLHVTGLPRYDALYNYKQAPASADRTVKHVLCCETYLPAYDFTDQAISANFLGPRASRDYLASAYQDLADIVLADPNIELKVKPHYAGQSSWKPVKNIQVLSHRENIFELLKETDLVITPNSTVILEAIMMNKPVIVLDYGRDGSANAYAEGGAIIVSEKASLENAVRGCLYDKAALEKLSLARQRSAERLQGCFDGNSRQRVVEAVTKAGLL